MNILFLAPFKDFTAKDGGYGNASLSYLDILNNLKDLGKISSIDCINTLDFSNINIDLSKKYDIALVITHPSTFNNKQLVNKFVTILSNAKEKYLHILWETCPLPKAWKFLWGDESLFTGFFAASYFLAFQLQQVTSKPIYYIPYFIKEQDKVIDPLDKVNNEDKFKILLMGQDTIRKGLEDGLTAFNRAFNNIDDVELIIKYHNLDVDQYHSFEEKVIKISQSNSNCQKNHVFILNKELNNDEVFDLYRESSVLLMPSRGEGFCLPIAESMSIGLPCIYTNWSAMSEVGESPYNCPVDYYLDESIGMYQYGYEIGSIYAYPSIYSIMKSLYFLYSKWKKDKLNYYTNAYENINLIKKRYNKDIVEKCFFHLFNKQNGLAPKNIINEDHLNRNKIQYMNLIKKYKG